MAILGGKTHLIPTGEETPIFKKGSNWGQGKGHPARKSPLEGSKNGAPQRKIKRAAQKGRRDAPWVANSVLGSMSVEERQGGKTKGGAQKKRRKSGEGTGGVGQKKKPRHDPKKKGQQEKWGDEEIGNTFVCVVPDGR